LTPELQKTIVALVKSGNDVKTACAVAGVGRATYYRWMARGACDDPVDAPYRVFAEEVERARAIAEAALVRSLADVSRLDWRVALERLARMYPERWAATSRARDGSVIRLSARRPDW
jgi:predicted site-specific integrase-resolvase